MACFRPNVSIPLYVIVIFFNLASWIDHDGLWAELPLLVNRLPEYWALPSYLTIVTQIAGVAPLVYFILNSIKPGLLGDVPMIYGVIIIGCASCVLQVFFWEETAIIGGQPHSVAFLILAFVSAMTDATSSMVFLAYMANLPAEYISAYYVGDGICGLLPSIAALIQGAGDYDCNVSYTTVNDSFGGTKNTSTVVHVMREPVFSAGVFFVLLAIIMAISGVSFTLLNYYPWCKRFHVTSQQAGTETTKLKRGKVNDGYASGSVNTFDSINEDSTMSSTIVLETREARREIPVAFLLVQYGFLNGMRYGTLYAIQSYSLLPYGNVAYSLGNRLTTVVLPFSSLVALFLPTRSIKIITLNTITGTIAAGYILVLASLSPNPPLKGTGIGTALAVLAWIVMSSSWGYAKVGIGLIMRDLGKRELIWAGAMDVLITTIFSVIMFILVAVLEVFKDEPKCASFMT